MKTLEYLRIQRESSAWTRRNPGNMALVRDTITEFCKYIPQRSFVLEIGSGDGYALDVLRAKGYQRIVGCDLSVTKLSVAASLRHDVVLQDLHSLGFRDGVFDAVYCAHTLEHSYDGYKAVEETFRTLRPGGLVFVIVPDHASVYGDTFVERQRVAPIEHRSLTLFEDILYRRKGIRTPTARNQFPFTMKLLMAVLIGAGFEVQFAARISRNGPELWAIGTKPESIGTHVNPILERPISKLSRVHMLYLKVAKRGRSFMKRLYHL